MDIICITHADFETPGVIETWALGNNHTFRVSKPYRGDDCLAIEDYDALIIMGGPQSAREIEHYSYLADEITLIQKAIMANKIILGFCLGAQLIGEAFGAKTQKSPEKEIGVFPVLLTEQGLQDSLLKDLPKKLAMIHWHNDMPGETETSEILAYSAGCPRQIIRYAPNIYGFQCHLEITAQGMLTMIEACESDLTPSQFTQTPEILMSHDYVSINHNLYKILDKLIQPIT